jgi:hypothetical protein
VTDRKVVCAAIKFGRMVVCGPRHFDMVMHNIIGHIEQPYLPKHPSQWIQGFVDQYGVFMSREEALSVAINANQIIKKHTPIDIIFSEDICINGNYKVDQILLDHHARSYPR